ncbi:hypothetical protein P43SY_008149 [Pythium insidiosum]|uniref:Kinesin motor domain-containing protein n=1 Tax=Pythium insidiosum TaxID=114742 RepID=A0AAD5M189_PYTIN|nr:hypothetical protein P43SY_008149 [Pythium insidiosum]
MSTPSLNRGGKTTPAPANPPPAPVLLLMDSPRKPGDGEHRLDRVPPESSKDDSTAVRKPTLVVGDATTRASIGSIPSTSSESLGRLLVEMTAQVQDERSRRSDVEKKNQSLILEIEQLQRDLLEMKTSRERSRRASGGVSADWDLATRPDDDASAMATSSPRDQSADYWWRELQEAKKAKDKALSEAHDRALQVMELQACVSMQHDELKALRVSEADVRFSLSQAEERSKELMQQYTILQQESQLLRDEVTHLNHEIGKRGVHFKALMDKWTEAQAQSEHLERENHAMLDKMKEMRQRHDALLGELEAARDERDALQHQVNHLKGAVAAKSAESRAFQAYGTNARDHLQAQHAIIQRQQIYRRKLHKTARDAVVLLRTVKASLASVRGPLVAIQNDFRLFLRNLQAPVLSLVTRSRRYAEVAHVEHQPLRVALANAELARRHLHDQVWRARRNALLVCQIRSSFTSSPSAALPVDKPIATASSQTVADSILSPADAATLVAHGGPRGPLLRANFATAELLLRESDRETVTVRLDAVFSDRAREWSHDESLTPLLQSVLDGYNACVTTFDGLLPLRVGAASHSVPEVVLGELFRVLQSHGAHFHRVKLTISFLAVFNEAIYDLLGLELGSQSTGTSSSSSSSSSAPKIVVLEVQNAEEALLVLQGGLVNLEAAHQQGAIDREFTHRVITVCVTHENLLLGALASTTKSKLQLVELATGSVAPPDIAAGDEDDSARVKAQVAMDNGLQALLSALAEVRSKDPAFVRYHSSKLTVLLQDTIKATAKFLAVAALPATLHHQHASTADASSVPWSSPSLERRAAVVTRWLHGIRAAVGTGGGPSGPVDRTVEGFIHRYTMAQDGSARPIGFAPLVAASAAEDETDGRRWEKELELMGRRYGDLQQFSAAFYKEVPETALAAAWSARTAEPEPKSSDRMSPGSRRASSPSRRGSVSAVDLIDVVLPSATGGASAPAASPTPAVQSSSSKSKAKSKAKSYVASTAPRTRGHGRSQSTMGTAPTSHLHARAMTLAPSTDARPLLKVRRETASSALKKALSPSLGAARMSSMHARLQKRKVPFR